MSHKVHVRDLFFHVFSTNKHCWIWGERRLKEDLEKFAGEGQLASPSSQPGGQVAPDAGASAKPSEAAGPSSSGSGQPKQQGVEDQKEVQGSGASGKEQKKIDASDLTQMFGKEALTLKGVTQLSCSQRVQFEKCSLVVPSVTLNKFKQVESTPLDLRKYVGVLGEDTCNMYKLQRTILCTMMMGDFVSNPDDFWAHVVVQLKDRTARAVFVFDNFQGDKDEACVYTRFQYQMDKQEVWSLLEFFSGLGLPQGLSEPNKEIVSFPCLTRHPEVNGENHVWVRKLLY